MVPLARQYGAVQRWTKRKLLYFGSGQNFPTCKQNQRLSGTQSPGGKRVWSQATSEDAYNTLSIPDPLPGWFSPDLDFGMALMIVK
jgi:hypothetical protein